MRQESLDLEKALRLIGLARRANAVIFGAEACEKAIRQGRAQALLIAKDSGNATKKRFQNLAAEAKLPVSGVLDGFRLSQAIGKNNIAVIALSGEHFATEIMRLLE